MQWCLKSHFQIYILFLSEQRNPILNSLELTLYST